MILIIARPSDCAAVVLAQHWSRHDARVMTSNDLSQAGWQHALRDGSDGVAVIGGQRVPTSTIKGVLTRLPCVFAEDLVHVVAEDRAYIAEEMTAFLRSWLASLAVKVVNRPSPSSLAGPGWGAERWVRTAAELGLAVNPIRHRAPALPTKQPSAAEPDVVSVTVVGSRCFGERGDALAAPAHRLAEAAGLDLLTVRFDGRATSTTFVGADPWPDIASPDVARAVAALFGGGPLS